MNGSFFSQIYTNGAILSIFFYFSTPFLYACVFGVELFFNSLRFFNPSVLWALPLYDFATPRNAAGHGKGRGLNA